MGKNVIISTLPNISQNYLPKVNTSNIFANSLVYDNGTSVMIDTTTTHSSFANARLVVNRTGNSYIEIRAISGQSALALTTGTSSASATPTVEFFNSGNFGIVAYRPGVVTSNYLMYYNLSSSTNRYLAIQTEGQDRITINQNGTIDLTGALSGTSATFSDTISATKNRSNTAGTVGFKIAPADTVVSFGFRVDSATNSLNLDNSYDNTNLFKISLTGAATFSSSVTAANASLAQSSGIGLTIQSDWDRSATNNSQLYIRGNTNTNKQLRIGYDTTGNVGYIQALTSGTSVDNLLINPSGGNVGIGTTSPVKTLEVRGTLAISNSAASYWYMDRDDTDGRFKILTDGDAERFTILTGGNVGIGTTSPGNIVHAVYSSTGTVNYYDGARYMIQQGSNTANNFAGISFLGSGGSDAAAIWTVISAHTVSATTGNLVFGTTNSGGAATERMRITSGGNVGIGTASPDAIFHVAKSTSAGLGGQIVIDNPASSAVGNAVEISFLTDAGASGAGTRNGRIRVVNENAGNGSANMQFWTWNGGADAERMRITSGGSVGIGTSNPNVYGTAFTNQFTVSTTSGYANITVAGSSGNSGGIDFGNQTVRHSGIYALDGSNLAFYTNGSNSGSGLTERMRITSGGKVMVNTTDSGPNAYLFVSANSSQPYPLGAKGESTNQGLIGFFDNGNSVIGSISKSGSSVAYNTSSDYRLKEDLKDFNGLKLIESIKVFDFQWKSDNTRMYGVIAHELQEILGYAVVGDKDGEQMQQVDYSKLTPILIKAIQEQQAQIEEQKADIESLKALINK